MKIAFCPVHLSERGTSVSTYNYAYYNEVILKNKSIIIYQKNHYLTAPCMEEEFLKYFQCFTFNNFDEVDDIIEKENIDAIYIQKYGLFDGMLSKKCFNLIHSVFEPQIHGDVYAFISKFMTIKYNNIAPYVPYMVNLPNEEENLKEMLNIPDDAIVFGCYGGNDSFNIKFVHECINDIIDEYPNVYFLFMNINQNTKSHERIIYLPKTSENKFKVKFINTCNAMIHARDIGETFGLACAEFSSKGKPILTYLNVKDKEHIRNLGNRGFYYVNKESLKNIFEMFIKKVIPIKNVDYNCYKDYTPENVMKIFDEVFLQPIKNKKYRIAQ